MDKKQETKIEAKKPAKVKKARQLSLVLLVLIILALLLAIGSLVNVDLFKTQVKSHDKQQNEQSIQMQQQAENASSEIQALQQQILLNLKHYFELAIVVFAASVEVA